MKKSKAFISLCKKLDVDHTTIPEITTFEQACAALNVDPSKLPIIKGKHRNHIIADYKLTIIAEALREGKEADYRNTSAKYHAVFRVQADAKVLSGCGLSYFDYDYWDTASAVGVRLCFPSWNLAEYFGKQFIDLHKDYHLYT